MKTQTDVRVTMRVDKELKEQAEMLFDRLGMNMTTAFNVFLRKAVDEAAIPFPVSARVTGFGAGYSPADITGAFIGAVQDNIAANKQKGFPIAKYDPDQKKAYLETADGVRDYVNG